MATSAAKPDGPRMDIWVVENDMFTAVPRVSHYTGVEVRKSGIKVLVYGREKYIPNALGRKFFTDRAKMEAYVRRLVAHEKQLAENRVARCAEALADFSMVEIREHRATPLPPFSERRKPASADNERNLDI